MLYKIDLCKQMQQYKLKIRQLDRVLRPWHDLVQKHEQYNNWFQVIREALGVSTRYLAKKIGLSPGRIVQLQQAEIDGSITLRNLKKVAESLDCQLIYAFVPKNSLESIIENRAKEVAKEMLGSVNHTMSLEQQEVKKSELQEQYTDLVNELILENPKNLWKNHD